MSLHERYVLISDSHGVFLGTRKGFGIWGACNLTDRTSAPTYVTEEDAMQVRLLKQEHPLKVLCADPGQATLAEVVAAGGPAWAPGSPVEINPLPDHKVLIDPVVVADGKYTFFMEEDGLPNCLRHGEPWPAFRGSGSHLSGSQLALYHDLLAVRKQAEALATVIDVVVQAAAMGGYPVALGTCERWIKALRKIARGEA